MLGRADANRSFLVVETQKGPSMRFADSIFANLLKPINRGQFQKIVDHAGIVGNQPIGALARLGL